ncbi:MAG: hydroxymethylglutaryl-CoA lyase [Bacteroidota bacterium]|jgi:hydroxymethylglutaryl-CoA lyase
MIKIVECPRDAMQGLKDFIPTEKKISYINQLLEVGFDTIDFGSFVSPKAIPQMRDTAEVLQKLNFSNTKSKLLAIVANKKGAEDACTFEKINFLGFPFSISETFQKRNTNSTIEESLIRVDEIQNLCTRHNKKLLVYISMAFGNPYGDEWNPEIAVKWASKMNSLGIEFIALADTIGVSTPENIKLLFKQLIPEFKNIEFGAHLHSRKENAIEKIKSAYESGCKKFDSAINGFGGCPMAKDELTGNIATEDLLKYFYEIKLDTGINQNEFNKSVIDANKIFPN